MAVARPRRRPVADGAAPRLAPARLAEELRDRIRKPRALPGERRVTGLLADQFPVRQSLRVGRADRVWVARVGVVARGHDQRRRLDSLELLEPLERDRAWHDV